jgi:membrane-associated protease RseP (regulator of RpoE activity)
MSVIDGLLIFFSILFLYFIITYILLKKDILKKYNISLYGPALLLRTTKGKKFIKKISESNRFWKAFGSFGIVFCFVLMIIMVIILIWQAWTVLGFTPEQRAAIPGPEIALVLPGINPILPLEYIGYILLALVVAIIAHEFSHGILTFAQKLKVKSLGVLYLIVPIGAFVEPDEEQLKKADAKKRMRVYAAGPLANFVVVIISLLLFSFVFMSAVQPAAEGLGVLEVHEDSPADEIGIKTGAIITEINGTYFSDYETFTDRYIKYIQLMNNTNVNDTITISWFFEGSQNSGEITLDDRNKYLISDSNKGKGYNGVYSLIGVKENLDILKNPFTTDFPRGFLFFYVIPLIGYFQGYNPIVAPFTGQFEITGPLGVLPPALFWIIISALYWIFWLNLAVGLFNVLPMIPLDGGFLFNDAVGSIIKKIKKGISEETKDKIVRNVSITISLLILLAIIFPFIIRYI